MLNCFKPIFFYPVHTLKKNKPSFTKIQSKVQSLRDQYHFLLVVAIVGRQYSLFGIVYLFVFVAPSKTSVLLESDDSKYVL